MKTVSLGEIIRDARPGFASGEDTPDGIVQIRMNNVTTDGAFDWSKLRRVPEPKNIAELTVTPNDILLNATNSPDLVGKNAVFKGFSEPVTFSNHFIRLRLDDRKADSRLISRWLTDQWQRGRFKSICRQWVNQASLNKDQLLSLEIPLPSIDEQRRIAAILDQADDLRRKRREAIEKLDSFRSSTFSSMFGDFEKNELGWTQDILSNVVREDTIVTYGIVQAGDEYEDGVPYIRTGDIVKGEIQISQLRRTDPQIAAKFSRSRVEADEIVMSIRATVGTTAFVPTKLDGANLTQGTARISPGKRTERHYLLDYLRSDFAQNWLQRQVKGATFREITLNRLREMPILLPPLDRQKSYAARAAEIDNLKAEHRAHLGKLDSLFASLQHRAFRGEL